MSFKIDHPEQDPAEGSRKIVDRELARQRQHAHDAEEDGHRHQADEHVHKPVQQDHRPM